MRGQPGIGMPRRGRGGAEERVIDLITLTAEPGVIGASRRRAEFRAAVNTQASSTSPTSSTSTTAAASTLLPRPGAGRREGNVNVSKFGPRLAGAGGFINISQNAKKLVFVGSFSAAAR